MEQDRSTDTEKGIKERGGWTRIFSSERGIISIAAVSAFLIRLYFIPQNGVINGDGMYYATLGKRMFSGDVIGGISAYWSPFYSFLVGLSTIFFSDVEYGGRFMSALGGSLLVIPAFLLAKELYGRTQAIISIAVITFHPYLILASVSVLTEAYYGLFLISALLVFWRAINGTTLLPYLATGILFGFAYLLKPEALGLLALLLVVGAIAAFIRKAFGSRRYLAAGLLVLSGFFVLCLPYVAVIYERTGVLTVSMKITSNIPLLDFGPGILKLTADGKTTMKDRLWHDEYTGSATFSESKPSALEGQQPGFDSAAIQEAYGWVSYLLKKQLREHVPAVLTYPLLFFVLVGFFFSPWDGKRTAKELYLGSFVGANFMGYAVTVSELRYMYPILPIMVFWGANGIVGFSGWLLKSVAANAGERKWLNKKWLVPAITLVFLIYLIPRISDAMSIDGIQYVPYEEKQAGLWLREHSRDERPVVLASDFTVAFYAGAKHLFIPDEDLATVLDYARRRNVDYLVFSERRRGRTPNAFPSELVGTNDDLKLIYEKEPKKPYRIRIYRIGDK